MIFSNRRLRLLYLALAAMDMAVLLPWLTSLSIFWARSGDPSALRLQSLLTQNPILLFALFWATMIVYMFLADLLNEWELSGGLRAIAILSVLFITSLLAVRLLLYPTLAPGDFLWLRETIFAVVNLIAGVRGEILLILTNYFLWVRVARYTDRSVTFFGVGLSFRLGMLLVVIGSTLLSYWSNQHIPAIVYLICFFAFGLSAVALARIDQKAIGFANSSGALLPWDRYAQLWVIIGGILAASLATATVYTPATLRTILGWFAPLGIALEWLLAGIAFALFWLLTPLLEWLAARMQEMMANAEPLQLPEGAPPPPDPMTLTDAVREFAMLRYCIGAAILFGAIIIFLIVYSRMSKRDRKADPEETANEGGLRPGGINLGLDRLRDWFSMLGRYGVGSQLLAAISVENIYANLSRVARKKGFPRQPSQGPDRYLPTLMQAFPDHEAELTMITAAYNRVRYAERPITPEELDALRAAYATVTAPPEQSSGRRATT